MPKLINFSELNTLGVINITPNSFSGQNILLNSETLKSTLNHFLAIPSLVIDFGFESTAPMNLAISKEEERLRFDSFFDTIKDMDLSNRWISFDTYKPQNYLYFEEKFKTRYHDCGFIFNDVSGVLDSEVLQLLKSKQYQENFYYLYSSTHIPSRNNVLDHMKFINDGDIIQMSFEHFTKGHAQFREIGFLDKILFDPCFGFSKSYQQNWDLINRFDELVLKLKNNKINVPWLIGISKKSFLRKSLPDSIDPFNDSEILHAQIIEDLVSAQLGHLLFRAHDPELVQKSIKKQSKQL
ncbi:MAG: dihydropteroate synthase [Bacteriovorax sp.]|nr:dihydropteroate synthase [Bacteriovorax sp.]